MVLVTAEMVQKAKLKGACSDGLPSIGDSISSLSNSQISWAVYSQVVTDSELQSMTAAISPATIGADQIVLYGDGYGDGDGDGDGDGYGSGSGYGYGDGDGDGDGYGYGDGESLI